MAHSAKNATLRLSTKYLWLSGLFPFQFNSFRLSARTHTLKFTHIKHTNNAPFLFHHLFDRNTRFVNRLWLCSHNNNNNQHKIYIDFMPFHKPYQSYACSICLLYLREEKEEEEGKLTHTHTLLLRMWSSDVISYSYRNKNLWKSFIVWPICFQRCSVSKFKRVFLFQFML